MCTDVGDSDTQLAKWLSVFGPKITARLNDNAPGANLTDEHTYSIMSMCAFHTLVLERQSPFCDLFEEKEWAAYEYYGDLDKFYGNGLASLYSSKRLTLRRMLIRNGFEDMVKPWDQTKA